MKDIRNIENVSWTWLGNTTEKDFQVSKLYNNFIQSYTTVFELQKNAVENVDKFLTLRCFIFIFYFFRKRRLPDNVWVIFYVQFRGKSRLKFIYFISSLWPVFFIQFLFSPNDSPCFLFHLKSSFCFWDI